MSRVKEIIKKLQKNCKHKWIGVGREGLGGYSAWECSECGKTEGNPYR